MNIAAFFPKNLPYSSRIYFENISRELTILGHTVIPFAGKKLPAPVDVYWEISTGRNGPNVLLKKTTSPVVVTFHGAANLALPISECFGPGIRNRLAGYASRWISRYGWRWRDRFYDSVITLSDYAKKEAESCLGIPGHRITPIYHGVDHEIFTPADEPEKTEPYFLHISSYQPKKNLERIIEAYHRIPKRLKPRFIIVSPGYALSYGDEGIEIRLDPVDHEHTAKLYRNALGFIFPSLHETFGMPIIEAMACGCPVITSNDTGCAEISGTAALLVNSRSIDEITTAMIRILTDEQLRHTLRDNGIGRARGFTWNASAKKHVTVFQEAIQQHCTSSR
jgi:glycosyltransferase involved in cell wall biosynthesis